MNKLNKFLIFALILIALASSVSATEEISIRWDATGTTTAGVMGRYSNGNYYGQGQRFNSSTLEGITNITIRIATNVGSGTYGIDIGSSLGDIETSAICLSDNVVINSIGEYTFTFESCSLDINAIYWYHIVRRGTFATNNYFQIYGTGGTNYVVDSENLYDNARAESASDDYTWSYPYLNDWDGSSKIRYNASPSVTNFTVTTNLNDYNITMVSNETLNFTANSTIYETGILVNDSRLWNITLSAENYQNITYTNYNISLNGSITTSLTPTQFNISFDAEQLYTNNAVTNFNITLENGSTYNDSTSYLIDYGYHNLTFSKDGYHNKTTTNKLINADTTITFNDVYNSLVAITFKDFLTNTTINNNATFNFTIGSTETEITTTNGTFLIPLIQTTLNNTISKSINYAYLEQNVTIDELDENFTFYLYSENSIWFYAKDLATNTEIENFSIEIYNVNHNYNGNESGNVIRINNITAGEYNVRVDKTSYQSSYYILTVGGGSHQTLTAYLTNTSDTLTFTTQSLQSGVIVEDVTASIYYLIESEWTLINSKNTDITGRVLFGVDNTKNYKFTFTKTDFETKSFILQPVFTEYTIKLIPTGYVTPDIDKGNYYVKITPFLIYSDQLNNITFNIVSGSGSLEYYDINISAPTDTEGGNFSNTYGGSHIFTINVSDTNIIDTLNVTYGVKEVGEEYKTYTVLINIQTYNLNEDNTFYGFKNSMEGYGYFEKGIIATIIMLILLGVVATVSHMTGGNTFVITGISLIVFMSFFVIVDFIPRWSLYIIGFSFILLLFAKLRGE